MRRPRWEPLWRITPFFRSRPCLIIAISISGLVFGNEAAQGQIFNQLRSLLDDESGRRDRSLRGSPSGYFNKFRVSRLGQH